MLIFFNEAKRYNIARKFSFALEFLEGTVTFNFFKTFIL